METAISPRELADAIGVSESSVKRWVDDGAIRATRTPGGHRRIAWAEAMRYVRESRAALPKLQLLGLSDVALARQRLAGGDDPAASLFRLLTAGERTAAAGLLLSLYLDGRSAAQIVDDVLRPAMERVGELWLADGSGVFREHRATDIAIHALARLRQASASPTATLTSVGGAPGGDPYLLPSLSAATVLAAEGLAAVNLGPDTPLAALEAAARELAAGLVWLSVSSPGRAEALGGEVRRLAARLAARGVPLVIGGAEVGRLDLREGPHLVVGGSMAELAALVRGLQLSAAAGSR